METCSICTNTVDSLNRRQVWGASFPNIHKNYIKEIVFKNLDPANAIDLSKLKNKLISDYICKICFNKLNKLEKIDFKIQNVVGKLRQERQELIAALSSHTAAVDLSLGLRSPSIFNSPKTTPIKHGKRLRLGTPTPKKFKSSKTAHIQNDEKLETKSTSKSLIFNSPDSTPTKHNKHNKNVRLGKTSKKTTKASNTCTHNAENEEPSSKSDEDPGLKKQLESIGCKRLSRDLFLGNDFDVRVQVKHKTKVKTRIIKDKQMMTALKGLVKYNTNQFVTNILNCEHFQKDIVKHVQSLIMKETRTLCSKKTPSHLRKTTPNDLCSVHITDIKHEWEERAPTFSAMLKSMSRSEGEEIKPPMIFAGAALLRSQCPEMSRLHYAVGLTLDHGGCIDQTIDLLGKWGVSMSAVSIRRKKKTLIEKQLQHISKIHMENEEQVQQFNGAIPQNDPIIPPDDPVPPLNDPIIPHDDPVPPQNDSIFPQDDPVPTQHDQILAQENQTPAHLNDGTILIPNHTQGTHLPQPMNANVQVIPNLVIGQQIENEQQNIDTNMQAANTSDPKTEIIGDNFDWTKHPHHMTEDAQRESLHWFLNIGLVRRVSGAHLDNSQPKSNIENIDNVEFLPSIGEIQSLQSNFIHHMCKIATKYVDALKPYSRAVPKHIPHAHMEELSKKSDFMILDLLEKNENKSDEIISILEHIHEHYIAHTIVDGQPKVVSKKVFGGDVLTNERAYSAQLAMLNGETDFDQLGGIIHRPEGLHRQMNLLLYIYQAFYTQDNNRDLGTLSQIRNRVNRRDVVGQEGVTKCFRSHYAFIQDCLEGHIVAAFEDVLEGNRPNPLLFHQDEQSQLEWLKKLATKVYQKHIQIDEAQTEVRDCIEMLDRERHQVTDLYDEEEHKYKCGPCGKSFIRFGNCKNHLINEHGYYFTDLDNLSKSKKPKGVISEIYKAAFLKCALLLRDTNDAYSMGDGERIFRNAKFEMLIDDIGGHVKYRLWLWRMLAYEKALLSEREAYEYKWNTTMSFIGGLGNNIPNDNMVEIFVHRLKDKVRHAGANLTYNVARVDALALQICEQIQNNLTQEAQVRTKGRRHTHRNVETEVRNIANILKDSAFYSERPLIDLLDFTDPFDKVDVADLHKWITEQKKRAKLEMQDD